MRIFAFIPFILVGCASSEDTPVTAPSTDSSIADTLTVDTAVAETIVTDSSASDTTDATCSLVKPYSSKDKPCNDCAAEKCCAEVNGCLGDKRCDDDYVNCILACALLPDDAGDAGGCISDCGTMYPAGKALYDTAIGCVEAACPTICK